MTEKNIKKSALLISFIFLIFTFFICEKVLAAGLVPCGTSENPSLCTLCHLVIGFKNIFEYLIYTVLFPLFTLGIVISGVLYMVSSGNKSLVEKAKTALTYSLMGAVIALTSWLLVNAVLHALGYKSVGNWWTYTCDTTPSKSAGTLGTGGATLPGSTDAPKGEAGTCGGMKVAQNADQCKYVSSELSGVLDCVNKKLALNSQESNFATKIFFKSISEAQAAGGVSISSIGLNKNSDWQTKCVGDNYVGKDYCSHTKYSCHFGGRYCQGEVQAVDLSGDRQSMLQAAATAKECGASYVLDEGNHIHLSVNNNKCGCDGGDD